MLFIARHIHQRNLWHNAHLWTQFPKKKLCSIGNVVCFEYRANDLLTSKWTPIWSAIILWNMPVSKCLTAQVWQLSEKKNWNEVPRLFSTLKQCHRKRARRLCRRRICQVLNQSTFNILVFRFPNVLIFNYETSPYLNTFLLLFLRNE